MFWIPCCEGEPVFEAIPAFRTRFYDGTFRPLAQARAAVERGRGMWLDLCKFERDPASGGEPVFRNSCVAAAFNFFPDGGGGSSGAFIFDSGGARAMHSFCNGKETGRFPGRLDPDCYRGADEQGWYWGVRCLIPFSLFPGTDAGAPLAPGSRISGNFYAFSHAGTRHFGAVAPFAAASVFDERNFAVFTVV